MSSHHLTGTYLLGLEPMVVLEYQGDLVVTLTGVLLPRESFRPIPFFPGGPASNEWSSPNELRPLKRLPIYPEDFPLLDQVGGHDDSELIHAEDLGEVVMSKVSHARRIPGGMEVTLTWDDELAGVMDEYLSTHRKFTPDVDRQVVVVESGSGEATMRVKGPDGFVQSYEKPLSKHGVDVKREA